LWLKIDPTRPLVASDAEPAAGEIAS